MALAVRDRAAAGKGTPGTLQWQLLQERKKNMPRSARKFCDFYSSKTHANAAAGHPQT